MALNDEIEAIMVAERRFNSKDALVFHNYHQNGLKAALSEVSPDYWMLHHPYTSALAEWGYIITHEGLHNGPPYPEYVQKLAKPNEGVLMDTVTNDWIGLIRRWLPEDGPEISTSAWDGRIMQHLERVIPVLESALRLPDEMPEVGLSHEDMRDIFTYVKVYKVAREKGFDAAKSTLTELLA